MRMLLTPLQHPVRFSAAFKMSSRFYQEMQESFRNNNKSREFAAHTAKVHSVAWSCDGRRLASGSFDKTASVFVLEKDRLVSPGGSFIYEFKLFCVMFSFFSITPLLATAVNMIKYL